MKWEPSQQVPQPTMGPSRSPRDHVTAAEGRVLSQLRLGLSNRAIAEALVLSRRTVESHVSSLLAKTGCRSRTELLLWDLNSAYAPGDTMPDAGQAPSRQEPCWPA